MEKEIFENGIKLNINHKGVKKDNVMLFENYAYDLVDMVPMSNLQDAIDAGASVPEKLFKVISIDENRCELSFSEDKDNFILKLGDSIEQNDVSVELVGIRINAKNFDDWKTL